MIAYLRAELPGHNPTEEETSGMSSFVAALLMADYNYRRSSRPKNAVVYSGRNVQQGEQVGVSIPGGAVVTGRHEPMVNPRALVDLTTGDLHDLKRVLVQRTSGR
jgi:hypothetical protein